MTNARLILFSYLNVFTFPPQKNAVRQLGQCLLRLSDGGAFAKPEVGVAQRGRQN